MHQHQVTIEWQLNGPSFTRGQYSRSHTWIFDGGLKIPASPSPSIVGKPWSNPENVDPEEAFLASVSSCHMLTFLWLAAKEGRIISNYRDHATALMSKSESGSMWISHITLHPEISWQENQASPDELDSLHHQAHQQCFIAQSVRTKITIQCR